MMKTTNFKFQKSPFILFGKKINVLFALILTVIFISCSEEGPAGAAGKDGTNGTNGTNGQNGNANVQQYTFGSKTITGNTIYTIPNITQTQLDNNVILAYCQINGNGYWYPVPGMGFASGYIIRNFYSIIGANLECDVYLRNFDGTTYNTAVTFSKYRVIIIPVTTNVTLAKGISKPDYTKMSYSEVCKYLNIAE